MSNGPCRRSWVTLVVLVSLAMGALQVTLPSVRAEAVAATTVYLPLIVKSSTSAVVLDPDYPWVVQYGHATVSSDISWHFSDEHARHLSRVWNYYAYSGLFARSRGNRIEFYYTYDEQKFNKALARCPTIVIPGARMLTACYSDIARWYVIPYTTPDYGTQLHEVSHDFLYATFPESEDFPWFKEGSGMYFEGGTFNATDQLIVNQPASYCTYWFHHYRNQGTLLPLATLVTTSKSPFLADASRTYSQSCMFFFYLMRNHASVMESLFERLSDQTIRDNAAVLDFMQSQTGMTLAQLATAYEEYALGYPYPWEEEQTDLALPCSFWEVTQSVTLTRHC